MGKIRRSETKWVRVDLWVSALLLGSVTACGPSVSESAAPEPEREWKIHDMDRPQPPVLTPGTPGTQEWPGEPPSDAVVLFDGTDLSAWQTRNGDPAPWIVKNGYFEVKPGSGSIFTRESFGDVQLHIEWAAPDPPIGEGQGRGNSGVFFMGLYEIQILDSYQSLTYPDGMVASVYGQHPPLLNAAKPPGKWQTYDIVFRRPLFDQDGNVLRPVRFIVFHNGVLVHENAEMSGPTAHEEFADYRPHPDSLPLMLQDHGDPVLFRSIWLRELPEIGR